MPYKKHQLDNNPPSVAVFNDGPFGRSMPIPEELQKRWDSAAEMTENGNPDDALEQLRSAWELSENDSQRSRTMRMAADVGTEMGASDEANRKKHWQKAYKNYSKALDLDSKNKDTRRNMNKLTSMMDENSITLGLGFQMFDEGNPTPLGLLAIFSSIALILASFKIATDFFTEDQGNPIVILNVEYVSADGVEVNGDIEIELYSDEAPMHVESFLMHTENFRYDLTEFHRVIDGFMIQGGDIENQKGGGGYAAQYYGWCNGQQATLEDCPDLEDWSIPYEHENGLKHTPGAIAAAHAGLNTDGSQFYIVPSDGSASHLDWVEGKDCSGKETPEKDDDGSCHTVFGYVIKGIEHVNSISEVEKEGDGQTPVNVVKLLSVQLKE